MRIDVDNDFVKELDKLRRKKRESRMKVSKDLIKLLRKAN
jgi:hypothetical protein